jgi:hypothetical protein
LKTPEAKKYQYVKLYWTEDRYNSNSSNNMKKGDIFPTAVHVSTLADELKSKRKTKRGISKGIFSQKKNWYTGMNHLGL